MLTPGPEKEDNPGLPKAARYARRAALFVWPLGVLLGLVLSSGQDAAGETLGLAIGLFIAMLASAAFGLAYLFLRSHARARLLCRFRWALLSIGAIAFAGLAGWYMAPLLEAQQYRLRVDNRSSRELTEVDIRIAGSTVSIDRIAANSEVYYDEALTKRPVGSATVAWTDEDGIRRSASGNSIGGPPRKYDGGELVVNIFSPYNVNTYFRTSNGLGETGKDESVETPIP